MAKMQNVIHETIDGSVYTSLADIAKAYGFKAPTIRRRYYAGLRGDELVTPLDTRHKRQRLVVDGQEYHSITALANAYDLSVSLVDSRYQRGYRDERLILPSGHLRDINETIDGQIYHTFREIADQYHVATKIVRQRYKRGLRAPPTQ